MQKNVPSLEEFLDQITLEIVDNSEAMEMILERAVGEGLLAEEFVIGFRKALSDLRSILTQRGKKYGNDVLFVLGEGGFVTLAMVKMLRIWWSFQQGNQMSDRDDSWIDLAGYATLRQAWRHFHHEAGGAAIAYEDYKGVEVRTSLRRWGGAGKAYFGPHIISERIDTGGLEKSVVDTGQIKGGNTNPDLNDCDCDACRRVD